MMSWTETEEGREEEGARDIAKDPGLRASLHGPAEVDLTDKGEPGVGIWMSWASLVLKVVEICQSTQIGGSWVFFRERGRCCS